MPSRQFLIPGLDPTGVVCLTKADLLQMFMAASPYGDIGFIIVQEAVPNVGLYPELAMFNWLKPSTGELKYYNGSSWQLAVTSVSIPDYSILLQKLSTTGGSAFDLIRVNAGGTAFEFVTLATLLSGLSLPVSTLIGGTAGQFLKTVGTTPTWANISGADLTDLSVSAIKLAADSVITAKILDANVTDAKLSATGVGSGTYGSALAIPVLTVNTKGRITAATTAAIPAAAHWSVKLSAPFTPPATGATAVIPFDTETLDPLNLFNTGTYTLTIATTGVYSISLFVAITGSAPTGRDTVVRLLSGATPVASFTHHEIASTEKYVIGATIVLPFTAADALTVDITDTASDTVAAASYFSGHRIA